MGLVKVGGHLERTNSSALSRLQVVQWHAFWSMAFYWTATLWGFCYHLIFFSGSVDQSLPRPQPGHCFETAAVGGLLCLYGLQRWHHCQIDALSVLRFYHGRWLSCAVWAGSLTPQWRNIMKRGLSVFPLWSDVGPVINLLSWTCNLCIREHSVVY